MIKDQLKNEESRAEIFEKNIENIARGWDNKRCERRLLRMGSIDVLQRIAQCPGLYIGERNIKKLDGFLCGYAICLSDHGIEDSDEFYFQGFTKFVNDKYLGGERLGDERWTSVILEKSKNEYDAFDKFVDLLNEYLKEAHLNSTHP